MCKTPEVSKKDGKSSCNITVACKRQFKNTDGVYDTDFINCQVWNVIAEKVCEYCKKGDLISVKGRIQNNNYLDKDDKMVYKYDIVAEQISFMSSSHNKNDEEIKEDKN